MGYRLLDTSQKDLWRHYWRELPVFQRDVYFLPEYYELYENDTVKAKCFVYEDGEKTALYPFLMTNINAIVNFKLDGQYFDIEGAYGYNGIAANTADQNFFSDFSAKFFDLCKNENIIAEFTRFNPVLANHKYSSYMEVEKSNTNVLVDLSMSDEDLWMKSYEHCVRKSVNKARKNNLQVLFFKGTELKEERLGEFMDIYYSSMKRNQAEKTYYFDKDYFRKLINSVGGNAFFFFTLLQGEAISCELVMVGGKTVYSFLGGTLSQYFPLRPNNLLKHEIIKQFKSMNYAFYCIGGGAKTDDGIFRYKRTFSTNGAVDFYIGKKIHNHEIYKYVCESWEKANPEKAQLCAQYFLKYKL